MGEFVKDEQFARKLFGFEEEGTLTPAQEALVNRISFERGKSVDQEYLHSTRIKDGEKLNVCIDGKRTKLAYVPLTCFQGLQLAAGGMLNLKQENSILKDQTIKTCSMLEEPFYLGGESQLTLLGVIENIKEMSKKYPNWVSELGADAQSIGVLVAFGNDPELQNLRGEKISNKKLELDRFKSYDIKRGLCGFSQDEELSQEQIDMMGRLSFSFGGEQSLDPGSSSRIYLDGKPTMLYYKNQEYGLWTLTTGLEIDGFALPGYSLEEGNADAIQLRVKEELSLTKNEGIRFFDVEGIFYENNELSLVDVADNMERINKEHPGWLNHPKFDRATIDTLFEFLGRPKLKIQDLNQAQTIDPDHPVKSITLPEKGNKKKGRGL